MRFKPGVFMFISALLLTACSSHADKKTQPAWITVATHSETVPLYFNGTVEPLAVVSVTSPVEGAIAKQYFAYGQQIKKDQLLLTISSEQLQKDYQAALTDYLKAKEAYNKTSTQNRGAEELYKMGISSRNAYLDQIAQVNDAKFSYQQAQQKLIEILKKAKSDSYQDLVKLNINDSDKVNQALAQHFNEIPVYAAADGVALVPDKTVNTGNNDNNNSSGKIAVGSQIKAGQLLLSIGDMTGVSFEIKVNEVNINDIKMGQQVTITSPAFPDISLQGSVAQINQQANADEMGGLPTFTVMLHVPQITAAQRTVIHVGMSAKVELLLIKPPVMQIPINAVTQDNGQSVVRVINPKTGKITKKAVITGTTTLDAVEIRQGLTPGEHVVTS